MNFALMDLITKSVEDNASLTPEERSERIRVVREQRERLERRWRVRDLESTSIDIGRRKVH